jgi:hypothetical protein
MQADANTNKEFCQTHDEVGVLCKYCVLEEFERKYGNNEKAMQALVYVFKILGYTLDTNSRYWWNDNSVDHKNKVIHIDCRNYGYFTRSLSNAADQLYQVLADDFYSQGTGLAETWETYLYRKVDGSICVVLGGGTTIGGGLLVISPEPVLTKVGGAGAVVFGTNTYYYGATTFVNRGGGTNVIGDAMGQYGQWMAGDEGEKNARFWIAVGGAGFETVGLVGKSLSGVTVKTAATNTVKFIKQLPAKATNTATKFTKAIDDIAKRCLTKFVSTTEKETIALKNAEEAAKAAAKNYKTYVNSRPAKTSSAVDVETGQIIGIGFSGSEYKRAIHPTLQAVLDTIDEISDIPWTKGNCGEAHIINELLHEATKAGTTPDFSKLRFKTVETKNPTVVAEPCDYCKLIFDHFGIIY